MLRRVVWLEFTYVSEVLAASIIRAMMVVLVMEATSIYEASENFYQTTRRSIPHDSHLHTI
jgi:hypothetical protein